MKSLIRQETELRSLTRRELTQRPSSILNTVEATQNRISFLESQLQQYSGMTERMSQALSDQYLIIKQQEKQINCAKEEISYLESFSKQKIDQLADDFRSAFHSEAEFRPNA